MEYYSFQEKTQSFIKRGEILLDNNSSVHILPNTKNHSNRFSITTRIPYQRTLYISVKNIERREEWITSLTDAISSHISNQGRLSAFALLSEPGQPGWMNAMFEAEQKQQNHHQNYHHNYHSPITPIGSYGASLANSEILKSEDSNELFIREYMID